MGECGGEAGGWEQGEDVGVEMRGVEERDSGVEGEGEAGWREGG